MTKEEKQLVLKILCEQLPYGILCKTKRYKPDTPQELVSVTPSYTYPCIQLSTYLYTIEDVKPYLRPMSSMTEEEVKDLLKVHIIAKYGKDSDYYKNLIRIERISKHDNNSWSAWIVFKNSCDKFESNTCFIIGRVNFETTINEIDWLNSNHFDYRNLIGKGGLALEAPEGMYKYNNYD